MSTDVAEVVGAALGLYLLFGIPLFAAGLIAGAGAFAILGLQQMGFRRLEAGIAVLAGVVLVSFVFEIVYASPNAGDVAGHLLVPGFSGTESVLLATGIIGATVMPHVDLPALGAHPAPDRRAGTKTSGGASSGFEKVDVVIAMTIAGVVNLSMMIMAAALFNKGGLTGIDSIEGAFRGAPADGVGSRGDDLRGRPAGLRIRLLLGRDDGRPGRHAGIHPAPDPDLRAARDHPGAGADRPGDRAWRRPTRS